MKKFGFNKSSKSSSPAPASANPYAVPQNDPYAQPSYPSQSSSSGGYGGLETPQYGGGNRMPPSSGAPPPSYDQGGYRSQRGYPAADDRYRAEKSPVPPGGYSGSRYANPPDSYGQQQGYGGANPYGTGSSAYSAPAPARGPGGYGGLETENPYGGMRREKSNDTAVSEEGRAALFGGAKDRYKQKAADEGLPPENGQTGGGYKASDGYGIDSGMEGVPTSGGYGGRQLTAEEQEEQDVQGTKNQIRELKQQDVSSTRNALRIAEQAEQTGRETLERLGVQGERIHNAERNLDIASSQNRIAADQAKELKHLNRSMWSVRVGNPFTSAKREREREEKLLDQHQVERMERDATRAAAYSSYARQEKAGRDMRDGTGAQIPKRNLAERSKYQFEQDSEDEAMEDEIEGNLDLLSGAASRMNNLSRAIGAEVDEQNKHIERITDKTDRVDDELTVNRARLERIR